MKNRQKSAPQRLLWAQFDALQMGSGWDEEDITKPQILLEDVFGDSHPGSVHLAGLMEQAKYGVFEKGGFPAQYHTTDICDGCAQGHDGMNYILASREAICDMIEVHGSVYPWDGMILAASCDKSIPAQLKAAARLDIPAIFIPGGSMRPGPDMTTSLVAGDISLRQKRKDAVTPQEVRDYKLTGCPSCGACTFLGTASTMQCMAEALGLTLPGAALMPATMRDILAYARKAGRKIMELVEKGITVSQILTREALENAVIVHSAIGGSTNATLHLPSIARELGMTLEPELFDELGARLKLGFPEAGDDPARGRVARIDAGQFLQLRRQLAVGPRGGEAPAHELRAAERLGLAPDQAHVGPGSAGEGGDGIHKAGLHAPFRQPVPDGGPGYAAAHDDDVE